MIKNISLFLFIIILFFFNVLIRLKIMKKNISNAFIDFKIMSIIIKKVKYIITTNILTTYDEVVRNSISL